MERCTHSWQCLLEYFEYAFKREKKGISLKFNNQSRPFNDSEFVKRAAGRGPKSFQWFLS